MNPTANKTQRVRLAVARLLPFLVMLVLLASFVFRNLAGASSDQGVVTQQTTVSWIESESPANSQAGGTNGHLDGAEPTTEPIP